MYDQARLNAKSLLITYVLRHPAPTYTHLLSHDGQVVCGKSKVGPLKPRMVPHCLTTSSRDPPSWFLSLAGSGDNHSGCFKKSKAERESGKKARGWERVKTREEADRAVRRGGGPGAGLHASKQSLRVQESDSWERLRSVFPPDPR